jgi:hypothetical protein
MLEVSTKQALACCGDIIDVLVCERWDDLDRL